MLIGSSSKKPSLAVIRRIKSTLRDALELPEDAMVTVTQLACLEEECAPLETVIGLLQPGLPQRQHKLHKDTDTVGPDDLTQVCEAWGHRVPRSVIDQLFKEN